MERSESSPARLVVGIGTPMTGRMVWAATTPPRCAAPPAATIIAFRPRPAADRAYSDVRSGDRCAEIMSSSYGTPNRSRVCAVSIMTGKSVSLAIKIATRGRCLSRISAHLSPSLTGGRRRRSLFRGRATLPFPAGRVVSPRLLKLPQALGSDVSPVVHPVEMDFADGRVRFLDGRKQIFSDRGHSQDSPAGRSELAVSDLCPGVENS